MQDPGSLNNLRDIAQPPPVSWWPPAPGWWIVLALVTLALLALLFQVWKHWRANAYRRSALADLEQATCDSEIIQILKRTAICAGGREEVGSLAGDRWRRWLGEQGGVAVPDSLVEPIEVGVYRDGSQRTPGLAQFARQWIVRHPRIPSGTGNESQLGPETC